MDLIESFGYISELVSDILITDEDLLKGLPETLDLPPDIDDLINEGQVAFPGGAGAFDTGDVPTG